MRDASAPRNLRTTVRFSLISTLGLLMVGCAIPARLEHPALVTTAPTEGIPTRADAAWPTTDWWTGYGDAQLDELEYRALAGAPDLTVSQKRLEQAVRSVQVARTTGGAALDATAQVTRQRLSEHGLIPPQFLGFTWYSQADLGLQFRYDFDWWGKRRAQIEAALDQVRASQAEHTAAKLVLTAAIADTYFGWLADRQRQVLAQQLVTGLSLQHQLTAKRVAHGLDPSDHEREIAMQVAAAAEQHTQLEISAKLRLAALAALLGVAPAELSALEQKPLPPSRGAVPKDAGLNLLARRPDVAASRWRVEAALKNSDVVHTEFYPDISISALVGLSSIDLERTLNAGSRVINTGPALHLPLFNGGLRARFRVSEAQLASAVADYERSVVEAATDVANQALRLDQARARRGARDDQITAATQLRDSAAARFRQGIADQRVVLATEAQLLLQRDAALALDAEALSAEVALIRALGGGFHSPFGTPLSATASFATP